MYRRWIFVFIDVIASACGVIFELKTFYYIFYMLSYGYDPFSLSMVWDSLTISAFCIILHNMLTTLFDLADKLENKGVRVWKRKKKRSLTDSKKRQKNISYNS